jgi:NADPH:quinone reductase-like Zn-dependent oxidoreductase
MRAAVIHGKNQAPVVEDFQAPEADGDALLIDITTGAIGPTDLMRAAGFFGPMAYPYVPAGEGTGRLADGSRVYFGHSVAPFGGWAERTLVPAAEVWPIPDEISDEHAVTLAISGTGALIPLEEARIQPGERILILGATGPLGQLALQLARLLGAGVVVGAARDRDSLARVRERGWADEIVQLGQGDDLAALKAAAGDGYDVILDTVYGPPAEAAMKASAPGARMMSIGVAAGATVTLGLGDLVMRSHIGVGTGQRPVAERRAAYERLLDYGMKAALTADVLVFPLDEAADAWKAQSQSSHAKIIVRP